MKVGIMSMQRIANYGSFLQAYALKHIITGLGHTVSFVDYHVGAPLIADASLKKSDNRTGIVFYLKLLLKKLLGKQIYFAERYKIMLSALGVGEKMLYNTQVDTLLIGSDEVFNCLQTNPDVGFSPELFGKDANAKKLISYAASFGHTTLQGLKDAEIYDNIKEYLDNFSALSLRDENSLTIAKEMELKNLHTHLDPVLIYGFENEIIEKKKLKDYILVYSYDGRIKDKAEIDSIRSFALKHKKKILTVGFHQDWSDIKLEATPFELLGYVKNADFVVTDTFHGTIFSIITKRRFATLIRNSNRQKLSSLLKGLELENRIVEDITQLEEYILPDVDYEHTFKIINQEKKRSIEYLKKNL